MSSYATHSDLKNAAGIDTSKLAKKVDLAKSNSAVDELDTDQLKIVPIDLSNLSNVEKGGVVKMLILFRILIVLV